MSVSTGTHSNTRTRTAVHLADAIMGTFAHILGHFGLSSSYLDRHWTTIEAGLITWIAEGSLTEVRLECGNSANADAVFRVPLTYTFTGSGDITFVTSQARVTRALAKLTAVPAGSDYRVVVGFNGPRTPVNGWSSTSFADTSGMSSYALGGLASGPDAAASLTSYSRGA